MNALSCINRMLAIAGGTTWNSDSKTLTSISFQNNKRASEPYRSNKFEIKRKYSKADTEEISVHNVPHIEVDPITLEKLSDNTFTFFPYSDENDSIKGTTYNSESIIIYILITKELRDPVTRLSFSEKDIEVLNDKAVALGLPKIPASFSTWIDSGDSTDGDDLLSQSSSQLSSDTTSTTETSFSQQQILLKQEQLSNSVRSKNTILDFDAVLGGLIAEILTLIESKQHSNHYIECQLSMIFSEFSIPFDEFKQVSLEDAYMSLSSWKSFLKGSPKKPTPNHHGRLVIALTFLSDLWTSADKEQLELLRKGNYQQYLTPLEKSIEK